MQIITSERLPIKLWADKIEQQALDQAKNLANLPFAFKWVAIMPDCHPGYGMPIGGVLAAREVIIPNAVGVDIGCGMYAAQTDLHGLESRDIEEALRLIRQAIPLGFNHHKSDQAWQGFNRAPDSPVIQQELASHAASWAHWVVATTSSRSKKAATKTYLDHAPFRQPQLRPENRGTLSQEGRFALGESGF
jgi:RNA-splicing ligase RtcB